MLHAPAKIKKYWNNKKQKIEIFFSVDIYSRKFKKSLRPTTYSVTSKKSNILVESDQTSGNMLGLSLFLPVASEYFNANPVFHSMVKGGKYNRIKQQLRNYFSVGRNFGVLKSFLIASDRKISFKDLELFSQIKTRNELENFSLDGVHIGDLIYDLYLRRTENPTVNLRDLEYKKIFFECLSYFRNFQQIFENNNVSAICISHCVYHFAIPARLAFSRHVPVFQVTGETIYRMDESRTHAYTDYLDYPTRYQKLTEVERIEGIKLASQRLQSRFSGSIGVDMPYSTKSAFVVDEVSNKLEFPADGKLNILVATHDFFDSPHSFGNNFYPDFLLWLEKLGEISEQTDYHWYLKTHRDAVAEDEHIISDLLRRFPKFSKIDSNISHLEIINAGIDIALTVFGTIAMEYPALGVPVINASRNNPHVSYDFSWTPRNVQEYESSLKRLKSLRFEIDTSQVHEYYFMAHLYDPKSWIYKDYDEFLFDIGGYKESVSTKVFSYYLKNGSNRRSTPEVLNAVRNFLESQDYRLRKDHFRER